MDLFLPDFRGPKRHGGSAISDEKRARPCFLFGDPFPILKNRLSTLFGKPFTLTTLNKSPARALACVAPQRDQAAKRQGFSDNTLKTRLFKRCSHHPSTTFLSSGNVNGFSNPQTVRRTVLLSFAGRPPSIWNDGPRGVSNRSEATTAYQFQVPGALPEHRIFSLHTRF